MSKKIIIVGGVAGGASAAARLRRLDEQAEIILLERDEHISFANCGLPYYIGGTIQEREKLLVQTPQGLKDRFAIDVRVHSEAIAIYPDRKTIAIRSKEKGMYEETYDALILSPGAKPMRPPIPGIDHPKILSLRNIPDTDRIKELIDSRSVRHAVVIGGGFIGVEMAENLRERDLSVTLVEAAPHILAPFDSDMVVLLEKELKDHGVHLILENGVRSFHEQDSLIHITLENNAALTADLVILAIGVTPDTGFLSGSGIALGKKGHILVNQRMETSIPSIYAVGDAIEVQDLVTDQPAAIPLAGPANKQGRIAADNIAGIPSIYKGSQGTSIIKVFGLTAAATGNNTRNLSRQSIPHETVIVHPQSHASYYPGALPMTLKLIFDSNSRILGAQGVGAEGVDKRIDVIAAALRLKGTVTDLTELELSYAPPFSSAKDPVNMAGFAAENVLAKRTQTFTFDQLSGFDPQTTLLLDVRSDLEFANGHLPGALNIPVDSLRNRLHELDKNKLILAYCQVGLRGYIASRILTQNGFQVKNMTGGYKSASPLLADSVSSSPTFSELSMDEETQTMKKHSPAALPLAFDHSIDASGLCCPGPLMRVKQETDLLPAGKVLRVIASDPGFAEDIKAWCLRTHNPLLHLEKDHHTIIAFIKKGVTEKNLPQPVLPTEVSAKDNKTIVVFSGDLDKAMAAFIIANGAAAMGKKVTLFFTFWGLNILRKPDNPPVKKSFLDSMFGLMMPKGSRALSLSKMNMLGLGTAMMRHVMKSKNVSSLEELIASAQASGIEIVACQMSMDVMGLKQEELIDGIKIGGVGYYLSEAEDSNVNLFI